jgi:hypothetical protein
VRCILWRVVYAFPDARVDAQAVYIVYAVVVEKGTFIWTHNEHSPQAPQKTFPRRVCELDSSVSISRWQTHLVQYDLDHLMVTGAIGTHLRRHHSV